MSNVKLDDPQLLLKKFFEENALIQSDLESFNNFVEEGLNEILEENRIIEPTIIPPNVDDFKIRLDNIWVTKPKITEADGSERIIIFEGLWMNGDTYSITFSTFDSKSSGVTP